MSTKHKGVNLISRVSVLVALAASVCVAFSGCGQAKAFRSKSKVADATTQIKLLDQGLDSYRLDNGDYPSSLQGLVTNVDQTAKWDGPYIKPAKITKDPWGNEYHYVCPGKHDPTGFDLCSFGADGKEGGTGVAADITNWGY